jgi:hypothetical protein
MLYFLDLKLISKGTIMLIYKIIIKIFILLLVAFPTFGSAENTSIPDANFEQKLIDLGHDDVLDGTVLTATVEIITDLNVVNSGISDLTGIEAFTALTLLYVSGNQLTSLDVSANTALTFLYVQNNQLTSFDVSTNTALTNLYVHFNQLTSFDVSANTALNYLYVNANPDLTCIYVGDNVIGNTTLDENQFLSDIPCDD